MSSRASGIVLFVLSIPLLLFGISAGMDARHEAGVRAWQVEQAGSAADLRERARFADYAESTLRRLRDAEYNRNTLLAAAAAGVAGGIAVLATARRRREAAAPPPAPVDRTQRAFHIALIALGLGSAAVIYTVLFGSLSETMLVRIAPFWIFPTVFGYYGLVAQRMEARLQASHLDTVSDQLLTVIKESGFLGQVFAFLIHAPFLLVKSRQPWVTALVGSLIWAIALAVFFSVVFPTL